jgi:hypothetical protein
LGGENQDLNFSTAKPGTQNAFNEPTIILLVGLQGKAIALMALGQHAHCAARMACGMCEQRVFRYRP